MPLQIVYSDQLIGHHVHTHVHYEMLYVVEGAVSMTILGQEHLVQAGDLVFLNQFEEHATRLISEPYRRYYVLIPPQDLHAFHNDVELLSVFRFHGGHFPYAASAGPRKERFDFYFSLLHENAEWQGADQEVRTGALMGLILTETRALHPGLFTPAGEHTLLPIQEILDILDRDFAAPFSLEAIARQYHVSPGCLSAHFRRYVGMSPMQYITQSRLAQARRLLLKSDLTVQAIALQCGYADLSNFSRRFRQQFQCTPMQFRRAYQSQPSFPMRKK